MDAYIYGERRTLPDGFEAYGDRSRSAVVSIDNFCGVKSTRRNRK